MMMKVHFTVLTIVVILANTTMQIDAEGGFCDNKCGVRCSKAGMKDRCLRYCGICCRECNCVPSGTYGNRHECPCYGYKKNSKGNPKCP